MSAPLPGADPDWLEWARSLRAIAQTGLSFATSPFDVQRYEATREIAARILARGAGLDPAAVMTEFERETGYATPKVGVRGAVFRGEEILMVRERFDDHWALPGGWVDVGDLPGQAIEREIREESGYEARATKLLGVYDRRRYGHPPATEHIYILVFRCDLLGGSPQPSVETSAVGFFSEQALPPLSLGRSPPPLLSRIFEHRRHPEWPTDFD